MKLDDYNCSSTSSALSKRFVSQEALDKAVVNFIVKDAMPFSIVKSQNFQNLVLLGVPPGKRVLNYRTVMKRISERYTQMKDTIKAEFEKTTAVCVTADH